MADDEITAEEKRWFSRLHRVLRDMPDAVEIQVHSTFIQLNRVGAREEEFARIGHVDCVPSLAEISTERVYPCSESM